MTDTLVIALLLALIWYLLTRRKQPAIPPPALPPELRHFFLQVHGVAYRQAALRRCRVGDGLQLVPEPTNRHDPFAVKVCRANGDMIGYIPADQSGRMSHDLASGWVYRVTVEEIFPFSDDPDKFGCKIRLAVLRMSDYTEARRKPKE
ncbi:MAG TPA: HIRAN domain-containing protein [Candidatus Angelobacter sp.]|nr:HIRAN domain-containing protein [Candidatus Angelobacter sp.]